MAHLRDKQHRYCVLNLLRNHSRDKHLFKIFKVQTPPHPLSLETFLYQANRPLHSTQKTPPNMEKHQTPNFQPCSGARLHHNRSHNILNKFHCALQHLLHNRRDRSIYVCTYKPFCGTIKRCKKSTYYMARWVQARPPG